jgi:N-acyl amino acid synthase of PEP-CTERM/exosortase system
MFDEHFEVFVADTPRARQINYRIRYQVYCRETGFEDARVFPNGEECDHYDRQSVHFLVRHRSSGDWVAAMRLVLPERDSLPFEEVCGGQRTGPLPVPVRQSAEVSRLCMVEQFRRRGLERALPYQIQGPGHGDNASGEAERRTGPAVTMGLLRAAYAYNRRLGFRYWYFLVSPPLARILGRVGIGLVPAGPSCEHRGLRTPYYTDVERSQMGILASGTEATEIFAREPAYRLYSELGQATEAEPSLPARKWGLAEFRGLVSVMGV